MYILTIKGNESKGAYSVVDQVYEQVLFIFHDKDDAPKAKKPKRTAGIPSTASAKQTIVTNEIDDS